MTATLSTARDEIYDAFFDVWNVQAAAVNGGVTPPVDVEGKPFSTPQGKAFARIRIRHLEGSQATLSGGLGGGSRVRFNKSGLVTISVFQPTEQAKNTRLAEDLATIAKSAFEGKATPSQVWFRDVVAQEVAVEGPWFQMNVIATFNYDEFV